MATVTVPPEFFRGELRVYGNWHEALIRELLQNSSDANPSRIDVSFADVDGHGRVTFSDDGSGMSRAVLEDVYFALGRTTKNDAGSIGGFGRARVITCFAQAHYQIRTGNLHVDGVGGEYTIHETADRVKGCTFVIDLLDDSCERIRRACLRVLGSSALPVPVYVDGRRTIGMDQPGRATRLLRDESGSPWARVYASRGYGQLLVRVHGLAMFTRYLASGDNVVLELVPSRSREVLSASRDQLHTVFGDQLDAFISDLARNRRSALRPADTPLDLRVGGGGFLATDAGRAPKPATGSPAAIEGSPTAPHTGSHSVTATVLVRPANEAAYANMAAETDVLWQLPSSEGQRGPKPLGFDVYLLADSSDARVRKLARVWNPTSWGERSGRRRRGLLLTWKAAIGYGLELLVAAQPGLSRVLWTVGFTFDTETKALHRGVGGGHVFAVNPVNDAGLAAFQISKRSSRQNMLAIALHEVAHVVADGHDEEFASLLTQLVGLIDPVEADRVMRSAVAGA